MSLILPSVVLSFAMTQQQVLFLTGPAEGTVVTTARKWGLSFPIDSGAHPPARKAARKFRDDCFTTVHLRVDALAPVASRVVSVVEHLLTFQKGKLLHFD